MSICSIKNYIPRCQAVSLPVIPVTLDEESRKTDSVSIPSPTSPTFPVPIQTAKEDENTKAHVRGLGTQLSGGVSAENAGGPGFHPQYCQKENRKKKVHVRIRDDAPIK